MYEGLFTAVFSQRSELVLDVLVLNLLGRDDSHVLPPYYSLLHEVWLATNKQHIGFISFPLREKQFIVRLLWRSPVVKYLPFNQGMHSLACSVHNNMYLADMQYK